ncbi:MAG: Na+/H+ antiporter NhaA [Actinomycetia bacterium]|nr:Na+/H+ antiporter NhaA [Actinomycetes bacterium]
MPERKYVLALLRDETFGGALLMIAAVIALVWVNSPWGDVYLEISNIRVGPEALKLNLTLATWAADGLLAIFFFVAGAELRHELQVGTLKDPAKAAVPIAAALGGMVVPAILYFSINIIAPDGETVGWGIPMATDIAFALAVLAVVGRRLPVALRAFLLSLAVIDDLGAIIVIAVFYSSDFNLLTFVIAIACLIAYGLLQRARFRPWWVYLTLAVVAWGFMHASGVHATVAGVAAGLLTRVKTDPGETESPGDRAVHRIGPISAGFAVPVFAFFAAGVDLRGVGIAETITNPISIGVIVGLVIGKPVGVVGTAWLVARFTKAKLSDSVAWRDVLAVGFLAGIGFTVSLLIAELAFEEEPASLTSAKLSILVATLIAAACAAVVLKSRNRHYAQVYASEELDEDHDGIPDVYQDNSKPASDDGGDPDSGGPSR